MAFAIFSARIRIPLLAVAGLMILLGVVMDRLWVSNVGFVALIIGLALYFRVGTVRKDPLVVRPPVVGRWTPVNSPGTRVPSHGLHAWGQTYAIDLVYAASGDYRPEFAWTPLSRPADSFSSFGQPVVAPASGTVVGAYDKARDHRSRTSWPGLVYLVIEGALRELTGPKRLHDCGRLAISLQRYRRRERAAEKRRSLRVCRREREVTGYSLPPSPGGMLAFSRKTFVGS